LSKFLIFVVCSAIGGYGCFQCNEDKAKLNEGQIRVARKQGFLVRIFRSHLDTGRISWFTRHGQFKSSLKGRTQMSRVLLGVICGLVFGAIDIGIMLPMSFPDKKAAITAAFIARFGIGFVIGAARLPWPGWAVGLCFGLLLSIPDALITKAYGPIIGMGAVGGTIVGVIIGRFGR
jgi:hypothetical protein